MSAHAPGPWEAVPMPGKFMADRPRKFNDGVWYISQDSDKIPLAVLDHGDDLDAPTRERAGADARLMAAAPELLEALKETEIDLKILAGNIEDAVTRDRKWDGMDAVIRRWIARNAAAIAKAEAKS